MDPHLKTLQEELAAVIAGLTAEQRQQHPEGKWCATEILEHLYLTYTGTTKGFSRVLETQKATTTPATWMQRRNLLVVLGLGYLPSGREAPSFSRPRGLPTEKVVAEIMEKISEMDAMIANCEKKLGGRKLLDHPILGPLTGAQWRKFHLVHGRHHLRQIRKLQEGR
jgi:Protein of unknown function (DUF1569)